MSQDCIIRITTTLEHGDGPQNTNQEANLNRNSWHSPQLQTYEIYGLSFKNLDFCFFYYCFVILVKSLPVETRIKDIAMTNVAGISRKVLTVANYCTASMPANVSDAS